MDSQTLLVLLLILVAIAVVLLAVLVLRRPEARIGDLLERALRDEQREGRSELREQLEGLSRAQEVRIDGFARSLADLSTRTDQRLDVLRDTLSEDARKGRLESAESQQRFADALGQRLNELTQRNEQRIGEMRATLEGRLKELQADNAQKLEQMRATVDEKLQATLTQRLDASFSLVSERLEAVPTQSGNDLQPRWVAEGVEDGRVHAKSAASFGSSSSQPWSLSRKQRSMWLAGSLLNPLSTRRRRVPLAVGVRVNSTSVVLASSYGRPSFAQPGTQR